MIWQAVAVIGSSSVLCWIFISTSIDSTGTHVNHQAPQTFATMRRLRLKPPPFEFLLSTPSPARIVQFEQEEGAMLQFDRHVGVCNTDPHVGAAMIIVEDGAEKSCVGRGLETLRLNPHEGMVVSARASLMLASQALGRHGIMHTTDGNAVRISTRAVSLMFDKDDWTHLTPADFDMLRVHAGKYASVWRRYDADWCLFSTSRNRCLSLDHGALLAVSLLGLLAYLWLACDSKQIWTTIDGIGRWTRSVALSKPKKKKKRRTNLASDKKASTTSDETHSRKQSDTDETSTHRPPSPPSHETSDTKPVVEENGGRAPEVEALFASLVKDLIWDTAKDSIADSHNRLQVIQTSCGALSTIQIPFQGQVYQMHVANTSRIAEMAVDASSLAGRLVVSTRQELVDLFSPRPQ